MSTRILFISLIAVVIVGCSKDSSSPASTLGPTRLLISPSDGQSGVLVDAGIVLTFPEPADRSVVERNLHLISETAMADSFCPVSSSMGHGDMDMAMIDPGKMIHLMDSHRTQGWFQRNAERTQCTFRPDSLMAPGTRYMVRVGREMIQMMESRMGGRGMLGGHSGGMMNNDIMYHFRTRD